MTLVPILVDAFVLGRICGYIYLNYRDWFDIYVHMCHINQERCLARALSCNFAGQQLLHIIFVDAN